MGQLAMPSTGTGYPIMSLSDNHGGEGPHEILKQAYFRAVVRLRLRLGLDKVRGREIDAGRDDRHDPDMCTLL